MFTYGIPELALIGILALVIFGQERLPLLGTVLRRRLPAPPPAPAEPVAAPPGPPSAL